MTKQRRASPRRQRIRQASNASVHLSDVAALAGVSSGTVSRVLNRPQLVSSETTAAVRAAINTLGWVPNGAARALASNRSKTIGVIIPNLANPMFASMISAIQNSLLASGYILIIGFSAYDPEKALLETRSMVSRGIDGLILLGEDFGTDLWTLIDVQKVPHLIIYSYRNCRERHFVGFDNARAARQTVAHLLALGHKDFFILAQETSANDRALARLNGFIAEFEANNIHLPPDRIVEVPWSIGEACGAFRERLMDGMRASAVICSNDYLAAGAMAACYEFGLRVPEDISIVGFDDLEVAAYLQPPLTTVHVPAEDIGRAAAKALLDHIERRMPLQSREFEAGIVVRRSTSPPTSA